MCVFFGAWLVLAELISRLWWAKTFHTSCLLCLSSPTAEVLPNLLVLVKVKHIFCFY